MSKPLKPCCNDSSCAPSFSLSRRHFLHMTGSTVTLAALSRYNAMCSPVAGPFVKEDFLKLIPLDKKLDPAWVASLTARGEPETYTGEALDRIGMPVGGMFTGTLYLGGDGRLWLWDVFNNYRVGLEGHTATYNGRLLDSKAGSTYVDPLLASKHRHLSQGFSLVVKSPSGEIRRTLDTEKGTGFPEVSFTGEYPIGVVRYSDPEVPVKVKLEAFSPFIPLDVKDSSLPLTVFSFDLKNTGGDEIEVTLTGLLENGVFNDHRGLPGVRRVAFRQLDGATVAEMTASLDDDKLANTEEPVFEEWNQPKFSDSGWTVKGNAFGEGPVLKTTLPGYMGAIGGTTAAVANSHVPQAAAAQDSTAGDAATGRLLSKPFKITMPYVCCEIGGGTDMENLGLRVLVDGKTVASVTGRISNVLVAEALNVADYVGKEARIEIVDKATAGWGNTGIGKIWFSEKGVLNKDMLARMPDAGSMALALLGLPAEVRGAEQESKLKDRINGELGRTLRLKPGESATVNFLVAWYFPFMRPLIPGLSAEAHNRQYSQDFANVNAVVEYATKNFERLSSLTRLWRDTWYDSTLPYWFLNRTFANTSILASSTCFMFANNRFYADEGVGCCAGTCIHVWQYAQAPARIFPEIERNHREFVDFGLALMDDGTIRFRGENGDWFAVDGQAGRILGAYREHQMTPDKSFLTRIWPRVKKAIGRMIAADKDDDGIMHGPLHNTLDADWTGVVPWVNGMYHAALKAGEVMANEAGDKEFANKCAAIFAKGRAKLDKLCWRDDYGYYIQIGDPAKPTEVGAYEACHIDQVFAQSWANQVGLGEVITRDKARLSLESLWKYNFTPDVGPFREKNPAGRWFAMPGDGGMIMLSNPYAPDIEFTGPSAWTSMYFDECMSGFEHQVASHMMWENMVIESLAVTRVIHDRHHAELRNPYNEIECSDHYARAMASYGTYLAACGFEYDGPRRHIGFAPRLTPGDFKAAFTSAEGWGAFSQKLAGGTMNASLAVKYGQLPLKTLSLALPEAGPRGRKVAASLDGKPVAAGISVDGARATITLDVTINAGKTLTVQLT